MRNSRALWSDLPTNMMVSCTIKTQDRDKPHEPICYLALRVRWHDSRDSREYKEFSGLNEDNWLANVAYGVEWLEEHGAIINPFTPPPWEDVLERLNVRQEITTIKHHQFYDLRDLSP